MTTTNPHAETTRKAMDFLKDLASNLDGWNFTSEKDGVKLYNKTIGSSPIAIVRGETSIVGHEFTPQQIVSVATLPGARKIWDEKFDTSEIKQMFSRLESLFWAKLKTPWPISPRDMAATSLREVSDTECYVVMTSVEEDSIPPVSGCVRANLIVSGWRVLKTDAGINLTYITQVDLAGSIPTAFLKSVQQQVPLCAGAVVKYAQTYGFPPITDLCTATFKTENFEHAKKAYVATIEGPGECTWLISKKMFPSGTKVSITGDAKYELADGRLDLTEVKDLVTVTITKA